MTKKDKPTEDYSKPSDEIDYETFIIEETETNRVLLWRNTVNSRAKAGQEAGSLGPDGYRRIKWKGKRYLTHRILWFLEFGRWPKDQIDHINGNPSDNRSCNLREATHTQNMRNNKVPITNTSGVKGVCWHKPSKAWRAQIKVADKTLYLGVFADILLAKEAYNAAAIKYHGEYRRAAND